MLPTRVLMVDDEERFVATLSKRLTERGLDVTGVFSGEAAVKEIQKQLFDVIILDVKMPGMDGVETLREIKKLNPGIEVIMLTGHASVDSAVEGMKLGAFEYIMKPCEIEDLVEKIESAYKLKVERDERIRRAEVRRMVDRSPS